MIELHQLVKRFPDGTGIAYRDLTFETGKSYILLGASGCGKTTLLHMIAGVITPDEGTVTVGGVAEWDVRQLSPSGGVPHLLAALTGSDPDA